MINVKVKTLDNIDRNFDVSENEHISSSINISRGSQRLIYRGRVLSDDKILNTLDLDGKTLHIVEKPPNRPDQPSQNNVLPPGDHMIHEVTEQQIVIGRLIVPVIDMDRQAIMDSMRHVVERLTGNNQRGGLRVDREHENGDVEITLVLRDEGPLEIESPAYSRLHQIENTLSIIDNSLSQIESDSSSGDVPSENVSNDVRPKNETSNLDNSKPNEASAGPSTAETGQNSSAQQNSQNSTNHNRPNVTHRDANAAYYATVFEKVQRVQSRLERQQPRYLTILQNDADYTNEEMRESDNRFFTIMQSIMHNMSHIYHALSDLNVPFASRPPRIIEPRSSNHSISAIIRPPEAQITMHFVRSSDRSAEVTSVRRSSAPVPNGPNAFFQSMPTADSQNARQPNDATPINTNPQQQIIVGGRQIAVPTFANSDLFDTEGVSRNFSYITNRMPTVYVGGTGRGVGGNPILFNTSVPPPPINPNQSRPAAPLSVFDPRDVDVPSPPSLSAAFVSQYFGRGRGFRPTTVTPGGPVLPNNVTSVQIALPVVLAVGGPNAPSMPNMANMFSVAGRMPTFVGTRPPNFNQTATSQPPSATNDRSSTNFQNPPANHANAAPFLQNLFSQILPGIFNTGNPTVPNAATPQQTQPIRYPRSTLLNLAPSAGQSMPILHEEMFGNFSHSFVVPVASTQLASVNGSRLVFGNDPFLPCNSRRLADQAELWDSRPNDNATNYGRSGMPASIQDGGSHSMEDGFHSEDFEEAMERVLRSVLDCMRLHRSVQPTAVTVQTVIQTNSESDETSQTNWNANSSTQTVADSQHTNLLTSQNESLNASVQACENVQENSNQQDTPSSSSGTCENVGATNRSHEDDWKSQVPRDWVPIIEADIERQLKEPPVVEIRLSEAYLSGMPVKRKKPVKNSEDEKRQCPEEEIHDNNDVLEKNMKDESEDGLKKMFRKE